MDNNVYYLENSVDPPPQADSTPSEYEFKCGGCGAVWTMPAEYDPVYCPCCGDLL